MRKFILAASAAALAIAPAIAGNGGGHGGGNGGGKGDGHGGGGGEMRGPGGGGNGKGHGGGGGGDMRAMRGDGKDGGHAMRAEHGNRGGEMRHANREFRHAERHANREQVRNVRVVERVQDDRRFGNDRYANNGFVNGCPPGLAAKNNGCLPPGQAKKLVGALLPAAYTHSILSGPYANWYQDNDRYLYRQSGDSIYRVNRGTSLIDALIPYGGRDYGYYPVGQNYPADYNYYNVPTQYQSYYPDGGDYHYRYGDNAIYSVNPQNSAIQSIVALLAGDLGVGQRLPSNYGVYNVPMSYRDRYYDTADNQYRYNDGYIYRVDPRTQLITSVISALI